MAIIEKLLGKSADELEAMSHEELEKYFEPYLVITRPELAIKPQERHGPRRVERTGFTRKDSQKAKAQAILEKFGVKDVRL